MIVGVTLSANGVPESIRATRDDGVRGRLSR